MTAVIIAVALFVVVILLVLVAGLCRAAGRNRDLLP